MVIFLPGDPARNPDAPAQEPREIPAPGLKTVTTAQAPEQTGNQTPSTKKPPSQAAGIAGEHKPASTRSVSSTETREEAEKVELRHRSPPPDVAGRAGGGAGGRSRRRSMPIQSVSAAVEEGGRCPIQRLGQDQHPGCWVQKFVPVHPLWCHDVCMHIAVIVDTCSRLDPKLCPCLLLWCHY